MLNPEENEKPTSLDDMRLTKLMRDLGVEISKAQSQTGEVSPWRR
jgi:hypothetical protein